MFLLVYSYNLKGWNYSFKVNSKDDPCLDADLLMSVGGNYYDQQEDKIYYKAPLQHNGTKWRGAIVQQKATYQKEEDGKKKLVHPPPL